MRNYILVILLVACGNVRDDSQKDAPTVDPDTPVTPPPAPTLDAVVPDWGSLGGGTKVTLRGTGFAVTNLVVKIGAMTVTPTNVTDTAIQLTTPAGPYQAVDVVVTTDGGVAPSKSFRYLAPLYAADGQGGKIGKLYRIDPVTALAITIGPLQFGVTGLAITADGTIYGGTTGGGPVAATPTLITIDPYTAQATTVGILKTAANVGAGANDLAADGNTLFGWRGKTMSTIDTATGVVTLKPDNAFSAVGGGLSVLGTQLLLAPEKGSGRIFSVDRATGVASPGATMHAPAQSVNSMTTVGTTVFMSVSSPGVTPPAVRAGTTLVSVDPATGNSINVGAMRIDAANQLPLIDAIAGIPAQP